MIINKQNLTALFTAVKTAFNKGFRGATPLWQKVATSVPSSTGTEEYAWLGQFPRLREWIGERLIKNMADHGYSIKNKPFESTVAIPRDNIEDDTYGVYNPLYEELGYAALTHPDELVFGLLADAFTTKCFDGQFFCDTDHPVGNEDSGITSVSNMQAGASAPWFLLDASRPLKPLIFQQRKAYNLQAMTKEDDENVFMRREYIYGVDARCNVGFGLWQQAFGSKAALDATNFNSARAAMESLKSDEGRPLRIKPTLLVVGPSNRAAAEALIGTETLAAGGKNPLYQAVEILVVPDLI